MFRCRTRYLAGLAVKATQHNTDCHVTHIDLVTIYQKYIFAETEQTSDTHRFCREGKTFWPSYGIEVIFKAKLLANWGLYLIEYIKWHYF